jgi:uncharacterized protein (DUF302 family)
MIMNPTPATLTYCFKVPFEQALKTLRKALEAEQLCILNELDLSQHLQRELGVGLVPCKVLLVGGAIFLLEAMAFDTRAAVFLPLHLVVTRQGSQTIVHFFNSIMLSESGLPAGAKAPLSKLHGQIAKTLEKIATRQDLCLLNA